VKEAIKNFETDMNVTAAAEEKVRANLHCMFLCLSGDWKVRRRDALWVLEPRTPWRYEARYLPRAIRVPRGPLARVSQACYSVSQVLGHVHKCEIRLGPAQF
jgi:hypothetical protein